MDEDILGILVENREEGKEKKDGGAVEKKTSRLKVIRSKRMCNIEITSDFTQDQIVFGEEFEYVIGPQLP